MSNNNKKKTLKLITKEKRKMQLRKIKQKRISKNQKILKRTQIL